MFKKTVRRLFYFNLKNKKLTINVKKLLTNVFGAVIVQLSINVKKLSTYVYFDNEQNYFISKGKLKRRFNCEQRNGNI